MARQEADCRALAARHGWTVVDAFVDNDLSAYSGKSRPSYRRLLAAMQGREVDAVIAWHTDRLHRSPTELEDFISVAEAGRVRVETVQAGQLELGTPSGRMVARMLGSAARYESEHKAERIRRKAQELAQAGKVGGGGTRPYGYAADRVSIVESEATVIRELVGRFLAGESIGSLCKWLQDNGVATSTGGPWRTASLRRLLQSARISGQRETHGEIVAQAVWPAIITPEQTARVRAVLADPGRRTNRTTRRYLLKGLLRCHRCGTALVGRPREDGSRRYVCPGRPHPSGCGGTYILAEDLELWVAAAVLRRLDSPQVSRAIAGRQASDASATATGAQLAGARARLLELAEMFGKGELSRLELMAARGAAEKQVREAESVLAALSGTTALEGHIGNGEALAASWENLSLDRQRAIVQTLVDHLIVGPGTRGLNKFEPSRVTPFWRL